MSLATASASAGAGAGAAGAGMSMAHVAHASGPSAIAQHQPPPGTHAGPPPAGPGVAPPGTGYAALGADLLDKNQRMSLKQARSVARLPIVAVDLYGDGGQCGYFPPLDEDDDENIEEKKTKAQQDGPPAAAAVKVHALGKVSTTGTDLLFQTNDDASHRAVRKLLSKGRGYDAVLKDALTDDDTAAAAAGVVTLTKPHLLLGARRSSELHPSARTRYVLPSSTDDSTSTPAIAEETDGTVPGASLRDSTLDGSGTPRGDDFDRVSIHLRLHSKKKPLTMLPEEAVSIVLARSRKLARGAYRAAHPELDLDDGDDADGENGGGGEEGDGGEDSTGYSSYPTAVAVPGWACADATVESILDAASGNAAAPAVTFQRSVAALVGALLPHKGVHKLLRQLMSTVKSKDEERQKEALVEASRGGQPGPVEEYAPLLILAGVTSDGIEITAVQVSKVQSPDQEPHCPFGNVSVVGTACYQTDDPLSFTKKALDDVRTTVGQVMPEADEPDAVITYGTVGSQVKLMYELKKVLTQYGDEGKNDDDWDGWDQDITIHSTREECVASGLAVLAGIAHGRVHVVSIVQSKDGKHRPKAKPGLLVQDASACAVGFKMNYHNGDPAKWTPVKTAFDFDRRVPAGPYQIDLTAAECAAHADKGGKESHYEISDETELLTVAKSYEGSGGIPQREKAALALRVQVVQRCERGGPWVNVGDAMRPLTIEHSQKDEVEGDEDANKVACESAVLELGLGPVGIISTSLIGDGKSIVQATKSARNSKLLSYLGIAGAVLFFGGFLVKSYVEEKVFERDTQRVLAYYKHAAPNSFHDGDERQARYLVWKYKGKKDKLWRRLEAKYNVPVRHAWEWDDEDETENAKKEDTVEDLDGDEGEAGGGDDASGSGGSPSSEEGEGEL